MSETKKKSTTTSKPKAETKAAPKTPEEVLVEVVDLPAEAKSLDVMPEIELVEVTEAPKEIIKPKATTAVASKNDVVKPLGRSRRSKRM